ncbi:hypothetical protein [Streptomyces sirii]|uniref:hypothetical protein n=1 Tax=Streptomyces sirii TaxID=3127701 RepID=UPI003D363C31
MRTSLRAIHAALREGGRFAFETRHPQARAWEGWNPSNASDVADASTAEPGGALLRVDRTSLRFLDVATLNALLVQAGFAIEAQYGDWDRVPLTDTSREIITIAGKE